MRIILVTGLPATGKTTLARMLAARYDVPLLAKDPIKEGLMDSIGPVDAARSRQLSDLSFTMLFAQLAGTAKAGTDAILEGNFRAGQHEAALRDLADVRIAQVLCRLDEVKRQQRIALRAGDPARHAGHGEAHARLDPSNDCFLELAGPRLTHPGDAGAAALQDLLQQLDQWWR